MITYDITQFCYRQRKPIGLPFVDGEFVYATNGKVVISVRRVDYSGALAERTSVVESVIKTIRNYLCNVPQSTERFALGPVNSYPNPTMKCPSCEGTGFCRKCAICDGEGQVECPTCGSFEHDCDDCDGTGWFSAKPGDKDALKCDECDGKGEYEKDTPVAFAGTHFNSIFLRQLAALPSCFIFENSARLDPHFFQCYGASGIIMPMRIYEGDTHA